MTPSLAAATAAAAAPKNLRRSLSIGPSIYQVPHSRRRDGGARCPLVPASLLVYPPPLRSPLIGPRNFQANSRNTSRKLQRGARSLRGFLSQAGKYELIQLRRNIYSASLRRRNRHRV